jgi:endonuclease III
MNAKIAIKQLNELDRLSKPIRLAAEAWEEEWHVLISTIMSARTMDEVTIPVSEVLFEKYKTIEQLSEASIKEIQEIIKPVNFYINKSNYILECAKMLVKEYDSKVPHEIEELVKLPGVGRKTANVFLSEVGSYGIGIDTHCFRISRKLGWAKSDKPEIVEKELKELFPKKYWNFVNPITVRFGKTYTSRKKEAELLELVGKIK